MKNRKIGFCLYILRQNLIKIELNLWMNKLMLLHVRFIYSSRMKNAFNTWILVPAKYHLKTTQRKYTINNNANITKSSLWPSLDCKKVILLYQRWRKQVIMLSHNTFPMIISFWNTILFEKILSYNTNNVSSIDSFLSW